MLAGQIVTANRLADGIVVFFDASRHWVEQLAAAQILADKHATDAALAAAKQDEDRDIVVEPYLIDVVDRNGAPAAKHLREIIRAAGPTIRLDLGKQATAMAGG